jgi:hypothetical protein
MDKTSEPVKVEWTGGLGNEQSVKVDPYAGEITVNGRTFDIGALDSEDVPRWMYASQPRAADK